jgi:hypothetical protein
MSSLELSAWTGNPQIDSLLQGLAAIYQAVFPERLRCLPEVSRSMECRVWTEVMAGTYPAITKKLHPR